MLILYENGSHFLVLEALLEYMNFPTSENVVARSYCTATGGLASAECPGVATGYYKSDNIPRVCSHVFVPTEEELEAAAA